MERKKIIGEKLILRNTSRRSNVAMIRQVKEMMEGGGRKGRRKGGR